jgi:hypothetical protein
LRLSNSRRNDAAAKPAKKEAVMTALLELILLLRWMHWWESVVLQYGRNNTHHLSTIGHSSLGVSYLPTLRYHIPLLRIVLLLLLCDQCQQKFSKSKMKEKEEREK